ncbi:hypothetical protein ES705_32258 [subsurface metagenome]
MAKTKCDANEMLSWIAVAKACEGIQPDPSKITLAQLKKGVETVFAGGEGCYPKPKGVNLGVRTKELSAYKRRAETKTGKKFKDLY